MKRSKFVATEIESFKFLDLSNGFKKQRWVNEAGGWTELITWQIQFFMIGQSPHVFRERDQIITL